MEEITKKRYFGKYYADYEEWYEEHPKEYHDQVEFLRKIIPSGKGVEIGVGTGRFASALGIGYGVDYVPEMVEESIKKGVKAYLSDASNLPFEDKSFDYSFNIVTMCFLDKPIEALIESRRIARLVITVILDRECEYIQDIIKNPHGFYKYAVFYNEKELVGMYQAAGLINIRIFSDWFLTSDGQEYRMVAVVGE